MRKCRNWQTSKTKDLVIIAIVWVQVPSSAVSRSGGMADAQASGACSRKAVWVQVPSPASWKLFRGIWKAFLFCKNGRKKKGRGICFWGVRTFHERTKPGAAEDFLLKCSDVSRTGVCLARTQGPLQSDTSARKAGHYLRRKSSAAPGFWFLI